MHEKCSEKNFFFYFMTQITASVTGPTLVMLVSTKRDIHPEKDIFCKQKLCNKTLQLLTIISTRISSLYIIC